MATLGGLDKVLLEGLSNSYHFIDGATLIKSLRVNLRFAPHAIDSLSDLAAMGLIEVSGGTRVRISEAGKQALSREGRLSGPERAEFTRTD